MYNNPILAHQTKFISYGITWNCLFSDHVL